MDRPTELGGFAEMQAQFAEALLQRGGPVRCHARHIGSLGNAQDEWPPPAARL